MRDITIFGATSAGRGGVHLEKMSVSRSADIDTSMHVRVDVCVRVRVRMCFLFQAVLELVTDS